MDTIQFAHEDGIGIITLSREKALNALNSTLLNELERTGGRYGLQTMCEGGGQANVTIIERLT